MAGKVFHRDTATPATKDAIRRAGGDTLCLAIAMLENKRLLADYPFGDTYPKSKTPKQGDAANFGIFKMNWYMIQQCRSIRPIVANPSLPSAWKTAGARINADNELATTILLEATITWSMDPPNPAAPVPNNFWAGHRWGESGLRNLQGTPWQDIRNYYDAVQAIKDACDKDKDIWENRRRYGVNVKAV